MAIVSTRRAYSLGPTRALHVIREDRAQFVTFVVVQNAKTDPVRHLVRFRLSLGQAVDLSRFIVGITPHPRIDTELDIPRDVPIELSPDDLEELELIDEDPDDD